LKVNKQKSGKYNRYSTVTKNTAKERLRQFWEVFEKEDDVLVLINADPDALACAMAIKRLLRYRVKSITIGYPNEVRRLSNIAMMDLLKIQAERLQNLKLNDYSKKVMLDSQPPHLPIFQNIECDVVIDHHPVTNNWKATHVDIRPDYGAASSIMVEYLRAAELKPSVYLATALFYAIKIDTHNFEKKARIELRLSELGYFKTALAEMKVSKKRLYAHIGRVRSPDILVIIADFLNQVHDISWVFVSGIHGERLVVIFRCDGYKRNAGKLAAKIFGDIGSAGGHREAARAEVSLKQLDLQDHVFTTDTLKNITTEHL
jgi:nanoRNase/pAp phosphatase (c-di-AMP/oligoRNAs hydrolase)